MRIGLRRLPRRRDPRRRFRNRLLLGMVGVALLPLVAFAVLAVFELDTVAKSTANATETAILQRQQTLQQTALDQQRRRRSTTSMAGIDAAVQDPRWQRSPRPLAAPRRAHRSRPRGSPTLGDVSYRS